ncbi:hypothetical protein [Roseicella frigidaeris]|uniref:Uncharacterized protein n=1 Tax=Roseicella frigidaeris TaxID=2230885 RepID=A0A327MCG7_9PROT|nr:hypothetical protein [Roseicella frigidaeris]RAI59733.1 hypothetical protein DOO78_05585 [Roseicella frigidaeris]
MNKETELHPTGAMPQPPTDDAALLGALPKGWVMLGRCRAGLAKSAYPTGCWALAHPTSGIALLDIAPNVTPSAEARLRQALGAAYFWPAFPGYLPVWHGRIESAASRSLPGRMAQGFAELPPLTVPGKGAWIAAARAALADDPAWMVPGAAPCGRRPKAMIEPPFDLDDPPPERPPLWRGRFGMGLALLGTFTIGVVSGVILLSGATSDPAPQPVASVAQPPQAAPTSLAAASLSSDPAPGPAERGPVPPPQRPTQTSAAAAVAALAAELEATLAAARASAASPLVSETPPPADAPAERPAMAEKPAAPVEDGASAAPLAIVPASLPIPPPVPGAPPAARQRPQPQPQKVSNRPPPERIDRTCAAAVFRFQQGLPLTQAESGYLRNGCATRR